MKPLTRIRLFNLSLLAFFTSVTLAHADLDIGGILRIESPITLTNNGSQEVGAAAGMTVFIGEGDAILPDSSLNPLARGLLITDAVVGVVKVGTDYAVVATGNGSVIGVSDMVLSGLVQARVNMLQASVSETILVEGTGDFVNVSFNSSEIASPAGDPFYEILGNSIDIGVIGQLISTNINVRKISLDRSGTIEEALYFGISGAITSFSNGASDIVTLSDAVGDYLVMSDGVAAVLTGNFSSPALSAAGQFAMQINTTSSLVDAGYDLDGELRTLVAEAGPYVKILSQGAFLDLSGQPFLGNFDFQQEPGGDVVAQATSVTCVLGDGTENLLSITDGSGVLLLTPTGAGADIQGPATFTDPQLLTTGIFQLQINSTGATINQTLSINGSDFFLDLEADIIRMQAFDTQLSVNDSQLIGDFQFSEISSGKIGGLLENGTLILNDGVEDALILNNGSGVVFMDNAGTGMEFSGIVSAVDPGISIPGTYLASVNTGTQAINETLLISGQSINLVLPAGPYVRIGGMGASISIAGQDLVGNFTFEQQSSAPVSISVSQGSYSQGGGLVSFTDATGAMILFSNGIAGELIGTTSLSVPGLALASGLNFQTNTTGQAVDTNVNVGGSTIALSLPAGPFIQLIGVDASISIAGQSLSGGFVFEELSPSTVELTVAQASFTMGIDVFSASDCTGLLNLDSTGAAGALALSFSSFNSAAVSLAGTADLALINTRPTSVIGAFDLGGQIVSLDLPAGPYFRVPYFDASLVLNRLLIGGFPVNAIGNVVLEPFGGLVRMLIEEADLSGNGTTITLGTGSGDVLLTEGNLSVVLIAPAIDYGSSLAEILTVTGGELAVSSPVALQVHPGALQDGDVPLIDFSLASSSVTASDFGVVPALPTGFSLSVSGGQLLLSSAVKPDSDDDGLSDAWESLYGPDDTSLLPTDNSDGDDLPALAEFALGLNPTISDFPEITTAFVTIEGQDYFALTYPRNADAVGLVGIFTERSTDLGNTNPWSFDGTILESSSATEVTDRSRFPFTSGSREFLRLRFLKP